MPCEFVHIKGDDSSGLYFANQPSWCRTYYTDTIEIECAGVKEWAATLVNGTNTRPMDLDVLAAKGASWVQVVSPMVTATRYTHTTTDEATFDTGNHTYLPFYRMRIDRDAAGGVQGTLNIYIYLFRD